MTQKNQDHQTRPGPTPAEERAAAALAREALAPSGSIPAGDGAQPGATPAEIRALESIGAAMEAGMPLEQAARLAKGLGPACEALSHLSEQAEQRAKSAGPASKKPAPGA